MLVSILVFDSVFVKIFNVSEGRYVGEDVKVEITGFFTDGSAKSMDSVVLSEGKGWIHIPQGPHVIGLTALYKGERFPSQPIIVTNSSGDITIDVYDVVPDSKDIKIKVHSVGIFVDRGVKHIVEILSINNAGKRAFRGPLLSFYLPSKSMDFKVTGDENDYFITNDKITITPLVLPGEGTFGYDYVVLSGYFKIKRSGAEKYKVFSDNSVDIKVKNGVYQGLRDFEGQRFKVWETVGSLEIEVGTPPLYKEIKLYILAVAIVLVLFAIIIVFRRRLS